MPTRQLNRLWCKKCNDFELYHVHYHTDKPLLCNKCQTPYEEISLSEIPEDKLIKQRERYIKSESDALGKMFGTYLGAGFMSQEDRAIQEVLRMLSPPSEYDTEITEFDAGQKEINKKIREERAIVVKKQQAEKERDTQELLLYKGLTRNDTCKCGSGIKYKKCCSERIENLLIKHKLRW